MNEKDGAGVSPAVSDVPPETKWQGEHSVRTVA
jgi:hypothetical protein